MQKFRVEWDYATALTTISKYFLHPEERVTQNETLKDYIKRKAGGEAEVKKFFKEVQVDLSGIEYKFEEGTVHIPFMEKGRNYVGVFHSDKKNCIIQSPGGEKQTRDIGKDLKGEGALTTNPILSILIKEGKVIEIYVDGNEALRANKVEWIKNYRPVLTPSAEYLGQEVDINQLFTLSERKNMKEWLKKNCVKFRSILGESAIKWEGNKDTSNISHAASGDGVIYSGNMLLRFLFSETGKTAREELFDSYEVKKVSRLYDRSNDRYHEKRLADLALIIGFLEEYKRIIVERDVKEINKLIRGCLQDNGEEAHRKLLFFLSIYNEVCLSRHKTPVENRYPIKHAISLLTKGEQNKLVQLLTSLEAEEYRGMILVDDILMMLDKTAKLKNWAETFVAELKNRTLWMVSPEIWHEAGGLARVMQYHSTGMHNLLRYRDARLKTLELQYQYRIDENGKAQALDYTKDLTHSFKNLKKIDEFTITVGGKEVKVEASYGKNDLGIEGYFLRDIQPDRNSYYCHSLYNYRDPWMPSNGLPTWEEFSVFSSKASKEFLKRFSRKEKTQADEKGDVWKAPFTHFNDSQLSLAVIYHKIELDKEREKKQKDPDYEMDPIISGMVTGFTSHTYGNRKDYTLADGGGDRVMDFMEVPYKYRVVLKHIKDQLGEVYDMASGALRLSDWSGMVSEAQLKDLCVWDEWINDPFNPVAKKMKKELNDPFLGIDIIAVSNGDNRAATAEVFRTIAKGKYSKADVENLTLEQLREIRKIAKAQMRLEEGKTYYTSKQDGNFLDPKQLVMSYSGRLVPVKVDIENAFTYRNVEELAKGGVQVVVYGNRQTNNPESDRLVDYFIGMVNYLKMKNYAGRLIFVPRFSLKEERQLKAASDAGIHSSRAKTEAAGQTETNDTACYGLVIAPPRVGGFYNGGIGEGLFQRPGMTLNLKVLGEGNTIVPKLLDENSYREAFQSVTNLWEQKRIEPYQLTSNRLGRVLESDSTSAEYLRQFNEAVREKRRRDETRKVREQEESNGMAKIPSLSEQLLVPDKRENLKEYTVYKIKEMITQGRIDEARLLFFTGEMFRASKGSEEKLGTVVEVFNSLLNAYSEEGKDGQGENKRQYIEAFARVLIEDIVEFTGDDEKSVEIAQNVQLMVGQVLNIISWTDRSKTDTELGYLRNLRLTVDEGYMIKNDKRGKSFLDARILPNGTVEVKTEGSYGFYYRGFEGIKKLGKNILKCLTHDEAKAEKIEKKLVMYIMSHFPVPLNPEATPFLKKAVEEGKISPMHETFFLHGVLPWRMQVLSTGAGHLQVKKLDTGHVGVLDVKHVTEGTGFQVNVKYDFEGKRAATKIRRVAEGDVCISLPGWVDYMIGDNLRFNDFSVPLSDELAKKFDTSYDEKQLKETEKALADQEDYAPYIGMKTGEEIVLVKNPEIDLEEEPMWEKPVGKDILRGKSLVNLYGKFESMDQVYDFVQRLVVSIENTDVDEFKCPILTSAEAAKDLAKPLEVIKPVSLGKIKGIDDYIGSNDGFLKELVAPGVEKYKLIRIPVELIESVGVENIGDFLKTIQNSKRWQVELFSMKDSSKVICSYEYKTYGVIKKLLPQILCKEKRNRTNTITLFPVEKGETLLDSEFNRCWQDRLGGQPLNRTVISPVGIDFDPAGLVKGIFLGLVLSEIAANDNYTAESDFVSYEFSRYLKLCLALGQDRQDLEILLAQDLVDIARGDIKVFVNALNKLVKCLPIMPLNIEEKRAIYERAKEAWLRA
ncbi:MAG: hypothetical protein ABH844_00895 [Candidatus Omnitrophota bacterium]